MTLWQLMIAKPHHYVIGFVVFFAIAVGSVLILILDKKKKNQNKINGINDYVYLSDKYGLYGLYGFALLFAYLVVNTFYNYFGGSDLPVDASGWGQVGDFFGGILNPVFAFFSFMALLYTIRIQSEELRETRKEMARSASAQVESQLALQQQVYLAAKHNNLTYLHDLLKTADDRVRQVLDSRCESVSPDSYATNIGVFFDLFDGAFPIKNASHHDQIFSGFRRKFDRHLSLFETQIHSSLLELSLLLEGYKNEGGVDSVYTVYRSRHSEIVAKLTYIGTFERNGKLATLFRAEEMIVALGLADKPKPVDISPQ